MQLAYLIDCLTPTAITGAVADDRVVSKVAFDSRKVNGQSVFVAVPGTVADGHDYILQAIDNGAVAIVGSDQKRLRDLADATDGVTFITVKDSAAALSSLAGALFDYPSRDLTLVGVTGTNGKTTIASLLYDLFTDLGYKAGLLSTVEVRVASETLSTTHTTPDAVTINQHLAAMRDAGCSYCFMEVSSHAVDQKRVHGLTFAGGIFTNLSHDHLDYHLSFRDYLQAKKAFFDALPASAFALTNADDKNGEVMLQNTAAQKRFYSLRKVVDYRGKVLEDAAAGLQLEINGTQLFTRLLGRFNAYNLMAVYGAARELGVDRDEALVSLSKLEAPSGRLQIVPHPSGRFTAVVDYAHTPDALDNALQALRNTLPESARLLCVVGAGGDRDKTKRPVMARIAAKLADRVILTSDNPRTEDPEAILDDMEHGLESGEYRGKTLRITDRRQAIRTAIQLAGAKDIILVAGKGHETYQDIQGVKHAFDDRQIICEAIKESSHAR